MPGPSPKQISGPLTTDFTRYVQAPSNWQPWDIPANYQVASWDNEAVQGVPAIVANCNAVVAANQQPILLKVWMPVTQINPSG